MEPELCQLNDYGDTFRRWQQRMIQYRYEGFTHRAFRSPSTSCPRSDHSRGSCRGWSAKGRARNNPLPFDGHYERRDHRPTRVNPTDLDLNPNTRHLGTFTMDP